MKVHSIFKSIDGEVNHFHQGRIAIFIRFSQCNLECVYCDTKYAQGINSGKEMSIDQILKEVVKLGGKSITITGGEPLLQDDINMLIVKLLSKRMDVSIETNGSIRFSRLDGGANINYCTFVMDWKLPSSGMMEHMVYDNFLDLCKTDWVKFVVGHREDFDMAVNVMARLKANFCQANFAFSPVFGLKPAILVQWMIDSNVDAVLNLQIHKYIWGENPGREV